MVLGEVLGSGRYFVPRPSTIFSIGVRTYDERLYISVLVISLYLSVKAAMVFSFC